MPRHANRCRGVLFLVVRGLCKCFSWAVPRSKEPRQHPPSRPQYPHWSVESAPASQPFAKPCSVSSRAILNAACAPENHTGVDDCCSHLVLRGVPPTADAHPADTARSDCALTLQMTMPLAKHLHEALVGHAWRRLPTKHFSDNLSCLLKSVRQVRKFRRSPQ